MLFFSFVIWPQWNLRKSKYSLSFFNPVFYFILFFFVFFLLFHNAVISEPVLNALLAWIMQICVLELLYFSPDI